MMHIVIAIVISLYTNIYLFYPMWMYVCCIWIK